MPKRFPLTKRLSWRLEYFGYRTMEFVFSLLPLGLIDRIGSIIGALLFYLSSRYRRLVIRNLRIAFGEKKSRAEIQQLARATCQRTIANFLGTLKTTILPTNKVEEHVVVTGRDLLGQALNEGKGAILVLGHMGNWEILNRLHQFLPPGTPAGGIYQPLKNPLVDQLLLRRREQDGSKLFNKREGFHAPASFVKKGGLLIVVADQKVGRAGTPIPFFDRLSSLSPLPALLARKADAPVFAAGIETSAPGKWEVILEPIGKRPQTEQIIAALERLIRRSPADYLWLHNRWKLDGKTPLSTSSRKGKKKPAATAPLRVLLATTEEPDFEALQHYLAERSDQDFPLACEFLVVAEQPMNQPLHPEFTVHESIAPSPEQLAAQISAIDEGQVTPLELALLLTPSDTLGTALKLAKIPRVIKNTEKLPLEEFLRSKTVTTAES